MTRITLGFVLVLAACLDNGGSSDPGAPGPGPGGTPIQPVAGAWSYSDTPVSDTCPGNVDTQEAGTFAIDQVAATGFRIVPNDGTDPFDCTLSGAGFDCPDRIKTVDDLHPDLDAVITVHGAVNGTFSSSGTGTGSQHANATCVGTDCNAAGNVFPCSASVTFTIHAL